MSRTIKTLCKFTLPLITVAFFLIICMGMYGVVGIALMLGVMIDVPTIITVLIARYAHRTSRVILTVVLAAILGEVLVAMTSPTSDFGSMLMIRLAGQAVVAVIVRCWLKKSRPAPVMLTAGGEHV